MALETPSNAIGRIDVNQLVRPAEAVVEPRATAMLTDAFRQGVITADDIVSRIGELGKTREKAEIMQAKEAISPEAQALRAQQVATGTAVGATQQAEALKAKVYNDYPAVKYFDALAPVAGIQQPTLPDGRPDYKKMEVIGAQLALDQAKKSSAKAERENIVAHFDKDNRVVSAFTKQGMPVDPSHVTELERIVNTPFSQQAPGSVQTSADVMMNGPSPTISAPQIEPRRISQAPQAIPSPSGIPPVGTPVPGGFSMGPEIPPVKKAEDAVKRANDLAVSQSLLESIGKAKELVKQPGVVGPAAGSAPVQALNRLGAVFGITDNEYENQRELEILINKKVLEGAQVMKGNLSDKDVKFLKDSVPRLSDPPQIWDRFLDTWNNLTQQNISALNGAGTGTPGAAATAPAAAPASAPVRVNTPAEAPPTAQFIQAPDGRVFKNPNYRP